MELCEARSEIASEKSFIRDARVVLLSHILSDDCKYSGLLRVTEHLLNAAECECDRAMESLKD